MQQFNVAISEEMLTYCSSMQRKCVAIAIVFSTESGKRIIEIKVNATNKNHRKIQKKSYTLFISHWSQAQRYLRYRENTAHCNA